MATSEERREARYQRRKAKREQKAREAGGASFDEVFSFGNLCRAGKACCNGARWKTSTIHFENNLLAESLDTYEADRPYSFFRVDDIKKLAKVFADGNWAVRNGFLYEDLCFINQVDGGDEWWTLKYDRQAKEYVAFESFTLIPIIENGGFETLIGRLTNATIEQCKALEY